MTRRKVTECLLSDLFRDLQQTELLLRAVDTGYDGNGKYRKERVLEAKITSLINLLKRLITGDEEPVELECTSSK